MTVNRPTSPHLSVYKLPFAANLSILHRITGVALYAGAGLMVLWMVMAAYYPTYYSEFHELLNSWVGRVMLAGFLVAFYYHLANGIRHLFWDMGKGYTLPAANASGWAVVLFTLAASAASLYYVMQAQPQPAPQMQSIEGDYE